MSERTLVVAAAIVERERVLAARRTSPAEAAGRWELPGGKVEPGESPEVALVREIGEELGCLIEVLDWLPGEAPVGEAHVLRAATARITAGEARPRERDGHDAVRWLSVEELHEVDWLEPDLPFVEAIRDWLTSEEPVEIHRAVFFEEDDARAVAEQLGSDGWWAGVRRERYQGEDDDEDHPWAVETDAPAFVLEVLVDEHDGWFDLPEDGPDASVAPEPLDLPTSPRRIKRPPA
ncbi:(deoxy)nucleoside triphosphate pyrophosphohydrolase [Nocardioides sp. KR10-350]|uniref:(deoxy)nucleoside triphosphate pyrophosphohydrolase n=1 Tax=Nocardioides cheoyonin TaxID=3156615 RepID=UPI0032B5F4EC